MRRTYSNCDPTAALARALPTDAKCGGSPKWTKNALTPRNRCRPIAMRTKKRLGVPQRRFNRRKPVQKKAKRTSNPTSSDRDTIHAAPVRRGGYFVFAPRETPAAPGRPRRKDQRTSDLIQALLDNCASWHGSHLRYVALCRHQAGHFLRRLPYQGIVVLEQRLADPRRREPVAGDLAHRGHLGGRAGEEHLSRMADLRTVDRPLHHLH